MSISIRQIERETGANVSFHPKREVFTKLKIAVMVGAGVIGLTAFVVGILAQLHIIPGIPSQGIDAMLYLGGGLLLVDLAVLIISSRKHQKAVKPLKQFLEGEASKAKGLLRPGLIGAIKDAFAVHEVQALIIQGEQFSCYARKVGCCQSIHVFEEGERV